METLVIGIAAFIFLLSVVFFYIRKRKELESTPISFEPASGICDDELIQNSILIASTQIFTSADSNINPCSDSSSFDNSSNFSSCDSNVSGSSDY